MKRYAIWDKKTPILTPIGEVLSPEKWIERYPIAGLDSITVVCAAGEINGGLFTTLGQLVDTYKNQGCEFSEYATVEEKLATIEAFEDEREKESAIVAANTIAVEELNASSLASIAASLEYQNMMTLSDVEEV